MDMNNQPGVDIPEPEIGRGNGRILKTSSGLGYNINHIIGAGIFITPSNVWRLAQSPGSALMLWIFGGFVSLLGSMIYVELGTRFPDGSGEQKYLEETFNINKIAHIFSFVMITIILPGAIIADTYACSKYLLYAIKGNYGNEDIYFGIDYIELRFVTIALLLIITGYNMFSNRLAIRINQTFAIIKILILLTISIIGLVWLKDNSSRDHWKGIFNHTPPSYNNTLLNNNNTLLDKAHERSVSEQIGSYGNAMINVLFSYEGWNDLNYLTEELDSPARSLKLSAIFSVIITFILYLLTNVAFITVVDPTEAISSEDIIAISFGRTIFGEPGRIIILILILISAFGCVGSMVFMGSRAIAYAAKYNFIPGISQRLYYWGATPKYALLLQFVYCAVLILLAPVGTSFFPFFSDMSQYLAMVFYGVSAICLLVIKRKLTNAEYHHFKVHKYFIGLYLLCTCCIIVAPFFPIPSKNYESYMPFVISWVAIFIGASIWYLRDYKNVFRFCYL
ncbi:amino acid transporter [Gigaspora margarita]|uniref:Amino acid transporter n=1 Tax=Gigaspora margarita TaxID=4874 RepID=A0A8H4AHC0_GIGMA|nr:amino acid transporter [Gigaspora margarita]